MDAAIIPKMQKHYPVLLKEIISIISPQYGGTFIDCTFGQGGYTKKILEFENTNEDEESSFTQEAIGESTNEDKIRNDLKEFGVDSEAPDLFSSENETSSTENLLSQENENEEDDLEIPAFLRRQKN